MFEINCKNSRVNYLL